MVLFAEAARCDAFTAACAHLPLTSCLFSVFQDGFTFNSALSQCVLCESASNTDPIIVMSTFGFLLIVALVVYLRGFRIPESAMQRLPLSIVKHIDKGSGIPVFSSSREGLFFKATSLSSANCHLCNLFVYLSKWARLACFFSLSLMTGMLKVVWSTYQIVSTVSWNLSVTFPAPFDRLLFVLSYLQLDFLSLDCVQGKVSFMSRVYVMSLVPILLSLVIFIVYVARILLGATNRSRIHAQHFFAFLLLSYMVLPQVAMIQFQALDCDELAHNGESFLRTDSSINCNSAAYSYFKVADCLFIVVYQAIPVLWFVLLWRERRKLNPIVKNRSGNEEEQLRVILETRENDKTLGALRFLWSDYRPVSYYFEVVDMQRRILFIAVLPLAGSGAFRASVGCFLVILTIAFSREVSPFVHGSTNVLMIVAQYQVSEWWALGRPAHQQSYHAMIAQTGLVRGGTRRACYARRIFKRNRYKNGSPSLDSPFLRTDLHNILSRPDDPERFPRLVRPQRCFPWRRPPCLELRHHPLVGGMVYEQVLR